MTRAYRNSAFVLIRLKQAERRAIDDGDCFAADIDAGAWPSEDVAGILPDFRRQAGGFKATEAPWLMSAVIAWYTTYASLAAPDIDPEAAGDRLAALEKSPLLRFDPAVYGPQLDRLRYELLSRRLQAGTLTDAVAGTYFAGLDSAGAATFDARLQSGGDAQVWADLAAAYDRHPFLRNWADHRGREQAKVEADRLSRFTGEFHRWQAAVGRLRAQARAGIDWTDTWRDIDSRAEKLIETYAADLTDVTYQSLQLEWVREVRTALYDTLAVELAAVTVRLDPAVLGDGQDVRIELRVGDGEAVWISDPFPVGPAAPAGSGWVGTGQLDWRIPVAAEEAVTVTVLRIEDGEELLTVVYPALRDGTGAGALARPRESGDGKVDFRLRSSFWQQIELPDPGSV
jgi:hypothetical protein